MEEIIGRWREVNRANWDERVPIHLSGSFYDLPGFREKRDVLRDFETAEAGDVTGRSLVHLQCHFGQDTLSWAARGARVSGLDFSGPAVEAARVLAADLGIDARFVQADVYDAVEAFEGATFDIVYTGFGALLWLPDLPRWARVVADLLKPGGFLYLAEFHPFTNILDDATGGTVTHDYFDESAQIWDDPGSYADLSAETRNNVSVSWDHTLGSVVSAIAGAGLRIEFLHEHEDTLFPRYGNLQAGSNAVYRRPEGLPRIPMMYSIRAAKG
ncbi:class I SAM-dependent methyltransferase [Actinocorallia libanotica]|uniref:Class I SAM-dependent methyltransferase n=1 Tax=Actinocorallia libanotica TaxID=46162 RepID=A0ABP4BF45_9ACTN